MSKTTKTPASVTKIFEAMRATRDINGRARITASQVATLIRNRLKAEFPGVKFSVRKDGHDCVYIHWQDGPNAKKVDAIVDQYKFGGFDGMIDYAYSGHNWLLPDGSMRPAWIEGTTGQRSYVEEVATDCPVPGAVYVGCGPRYVFTSRDVSDELRAVMIDRAVRYYGLQDEYHPGGGDNQFIASRDESLGTLAYRLDREVYGV